MDKCEKQGLFDFNQLINAQKTGELMNNGMPPSKIKKYNCKNHREACVTLWMNGGKYRQELERKMSQHMQMAGQGIANVNGQQIGSGKKGEMLTKNDHSNEVKRLCRLRRRFSTNEIIFVFDFLLVLCKNAAYRND